MIEFSTGDHGFRQSSNHPVIDIRSEKSAFGGVHLGWFPTSSLTKLDRPYPPSSHSVERTPPTDPLLDPSYVLHQCSAMRIGTVRDLRNHYTSLPSWINAGEEIIITRRGKPVTRFIPERPEEPKKVNWADLPEVTRDRSGERMLSARESSDLIHDAAGKW